MYPVCLPRRARPVWMRADEVPSPASSLPVARRIQRCVVEPPPSRTGGRHSLCLRVLCIYDNASNKGTHLRLSAPLSAQPAPVRLGLICREGVMGRGHRAGKHGSGLGTFNAR